MDLKKAVEKRKSVKKFLVKKPNWKKIIKAIDFARFAPAAGNQNVMKFILVSDKDKIKEIAAATQQGFVGKVDYVVVAVSNPTELIRLYQDKNGNRYCAQQAGAAIENFWLGLTNEGLVTTWVGYFYEEQIKSALEIPEECIVEGVFPIGIEAKNVSELKKGKPDLDKLLFFDTWGNKLMEPRTRVQVDNL